MVCTQIISIAWKNGKCYFGRILILKCINENPKQKCYFPKTIMHPIVKGFIKLALPAGSIALSAWLWNTLFFYGIYQIMIFFLRWMFFVRHSDRLLASIYGLSTSIDWSYFVTLSVLMFGALYLFFSMLPKKTTQISSFFSFCFLHFYSPKPKTDFQPLLRIMRPISKALERLTLLLM